MASRLVGNRSAIISKPSIIMTRCYGCASARRQQAPSTKMSCANCIVASSREASRGLAGVYSYNPRRIAGSPVVFPNPAKNPALMEEFSAWLKDAPPTPSAAFDAHFRLTAIHPFGVGNGRTARLLMNLLLLRGGYPPVPVRPEDRKTYLDALERGSLAEDLRPFQMFMHERTGLNLGGVFGRLARGASPASPDPQMEAARADAARVTAGHKPHNPHHAPPRRSVPTASVAPPRDFRDAKWQYSGVTAVLDL